MTPDARAKLLAALAAVEACGTEASRDAVLMLMRAVDAFDDNEDISNQLLVLMLAVFPKQPEEPPKPDNLGTVVTELIARLRARCLD